MSPCPIRFENVPFLALEQGHRCPSPVSSVHPQQYDSNGGHSVNGLRVLIAQDHEVTRAILVTLLNLDFQVVGAVGDGEQLVQAAILLQPDVIISDINMPLLDGFSAMDELRSRGMEYPFVFVTTKDLPGLVPSIEQGPVGYVHKTDLFNELKLAINMVAHGIFYISRSLR